MVPMVAREARRDRDMVTALVSAKKRRMNQHVETASWAAQGKESFVEWTVELFCCLCSVDAAAESWDGIHPLKMAIF